MSAIVVDVCTSSVMKRIVVGSGPPVGADEPALDQRVGVGDHVRPDRGSASIQAESA